MTGPVSISRFPPPNPPVRSAIPRRIATAVIVLAVVGAAVLVVTRRSSHTGGLRTAVVGVHRVTQELDTVATVEAVSQASVSFPVAGTVSALNVDVGSEVAVGQALATLDTTSLQQALDSKQATLDRAQLILSKALAGEDVSALTRGGGGSGGSGAANASVSGASSTSGSSTASGLKAFPSSGHGGSGSGGSGAAVPTDAELTGARQAVIDAQRTLDADLRAAQAALDAASSACPTDATPGGPGPTTTTTTTTTVPDPSTTTSTEPSTTTSQPAGPGGPTTGGACTAALAHALDTQRAVAHDERAVTDASSTYAHLITVYASAQHTTSGSGSGGTGSGGSTTGRTGSSSAGTTTGRTGTGTSTSTAPSASDLIAYQKAVDAADDGVAVAQQAIAQATIVTPIDGTVVAVNLAKGDTVTASSSTATIVVVGQGGFEVSTRIAVNDLRKVKVGQDATVTPDGGHRSLPGKVVSIAVVGSTSGSTTTYPVVIGLTGDTSSLGNGGTASATIVTGSSTDALAVPTSAVTTDGTTHTVTVDDGGQTKQVTVSIGAVGRIWTEITKGLTAGQEVVLADLGQPLPGSATSSSNGTTTNGRGGAGGFVFPGGGGGGGPFGGGGNGPGG